MGINTIGNALALLGHIFNPQKIRQPMIPDIAEKPSCRPAAVQSPLPRIHPEAAGISSRQIADFLRELSDDETLNMQSILILRNGKLLTEAAFGEQDTHIWKHTFSACKSIVSLAVGFAVQEGFFSPEDRLVTLLDTHMSPLSRLSMKDLTVTHLLSMTTGASFNEASSMTERDWVKGFVSGTFAPGSFSYNSLNTYILSVIIKEKTGLSLTEFLKPRLFDPLGITEYFWERCPLGTEKGGWGLYIRPEDLAKIGVFVMKNGRWNGQQLLNQDYLDIATRTQSETGALSPLFDYGWQFWTGRNRNTFLMNGMLGQNVLGFRESGILLVSAAGNDETFPDGNYFAAAEKYFGGSFPASLPEDPAGYKALSAVLASLREQKTIPPKRRFPFLSKKTECTSLPTECDLLDGIKFAADDTDAPGASLMPLMLQVTTNNYGSGISALSFQKRGKTFYLHFEEENAGYLIPIGFNNSTDAELRFAGVPYLLKVLGSFVKDEDGRPILKIRISFAETPFTRYLKVYYTGRSPHVKLYETPGSSFIYTNVLGLKHSLVLAPIIGSTADKIDNRFLRFRIDKVFAPDITLSRQECGESAPK